MGESITKSTRFDCLTPAAVPLLPAALRCRFAALPAALNAAACPACRYALPPACRPLWPAVSLPLCLPAVKA
jgi:hypothetical protein